MAQITLRNYLQETEDAIKFGRIDDAYDNCRRILTYYPEFLDAHRLLGEVYLAQGQLEEAQQAFDWILANDPENVITYCDRALISEGLSDIDTALDCYQQAYELSRGNSQIRQQFNQLSAKAGQQEFMFSRAGLARLYMRGDLLTQAVQEWETVLAASPDRLDARIGLLETYWREGMYEKAEQLAGEILEEIPSCLKALLLLAHITSTSNMQQAQELIQRAEALDPELIMAQELFSDLIASQPNDPFLARIRKEPVLLDTEAELEPAQESPAEEPEAVANGSLSPTAASDPLFGWNNLESWSELDTIVVPQPDIEPAPESPALATWLSTDSQKVEAWADQLTNDHPALEGWQAAPEAEEGVESAQAYDVLDQQPWYQNEELATPTSGPTNSWEDASNLFPVEAANSRETSVQDTSHPLPPAWLDMLTKGDTLEPGGAETTLPSSFNIEEQGTLIMPVAPQASMEEAFSPPPAAQQSEQEPPFFFASDDNDIDMGWPEWLKSLGAATFEPEPTPQPEVEPAPEAAPESQYETPFTSWTDDIQPWSDQVDQLLPENEQHTLNALENLESELHAQGFTPLEPGTLSTIAQESTLSSALAQLGNLAQQAHQQEELVPPSPAPFTQLDETTWSQPYSPSQPIAQPAASINTPEPPPISPDHQEEIQAPVADSLPTIHTEVEPEPLQIPSNQAQQSAPQLPTETPPNPAAAPIQEASSSQPQHVEAASNHTLEPALNSNPSAPPDTLLIPSYHADALFENELETTMKRPAIRLQPMQQQPAKQPSAQQSQSISKGRSTDRTAGKAAESAANHKERLLKGYQYQLNGDYDEAMQEYRLIIRGAPELLSEVISNVRALLKLAPKYSLGYRILGDAYMRQGEYLQAMEAYNKALTMAKKAKSQAS